MRGLNMELYTSCQQLSHALEPPCKLIIQVFILPACKCKLIIQVCIPPAMEEEESNGTELSYSLVLLLYQVGRICKIHKCLD